MAARSTMSDIIQQVRDLTGATPSVWTTTSNNYFDDTQIQKVLDRNRRDFRFLQMQAKPQYIGGGSVNYFDYVIPVIGDIESTDGGTAVFWVEDGLGANIGTASYSVDYVNGIVTFTTNTDGTAYYATGRVYDVNGAAADVLDQWASHEQLSFDVTTAERGLKRSQKYEMLKANAQRFRAKAWTVQSAVIRSDVVGGQP